MPCIIAASNRTQAQTMNQAWLQRVKFNEQGLVPAIAQDASSGKVLMMAWMNREALALTARERVAVYWSRSRARLWRKGESSGHTQKIREIRLDCDADTVLLSVEQIGGIACHTGHERCFFTVLRDDWVSDEAVIKPVQDIYGDSN